MNTSAKITVLTGILTLCACSDNHTTTPDLTSDMASRTDMPLYVVDMPMDMPAEDMRPDAQEDLGDMKPTDMQDMSTTPFTYPPPTAWSNHGPGFPAVSFTEDQLYQGCAFLDGTTMDKDHHNLVVMYDGYLLMPWAHEGQYGALTFFDMSDPCAPTKVGEQDSIKMRETHSIGFMQHEGKRWAVTEGIETITMGGLLFWDITDSTSPKPVTNFNAPGFFYPDAYKRIILSAAWQGRYVYAAGSLNGIYVIDALDPNEPQLVNQYVFEPLMQSGQVQAVGNLLVVTTAEGRRAVLLDISDPENPQPIPGGDFQILDEHGEAKEAYFSNMSNGHIFFARKEGGGGLIIYDVRDPENPTRVGGYTSDGNGGYVFVKDNHAFVGESNFAVIYDVSDYTNVSEVQRLNLKGDLDTITPIGNMAVLSVDDKATPNQASSIAPWSTEPDTTPPHIDWIWPNDGSENLPVTSRFGLMFNEMTDVLSAFEGSVRLYRTDAQTPDEGRVPILVSTQENIVNVSPLQSLEPSTHYTLEVLKDGIVDYNGTPLEDTFTATFTTEAP